MGFLKSLIEEVEDGYKATIYYSWYYLWENSVSQTFSNQQEAKDWILKERCYGNITFPDITEINESKQHQTPTMSDKKRRRRRRKKG